MADMLTIGALATNAFKKALDVTSHNVANVNTEGYSRQRAELISNTPGDTGSAFLGGGTRVESVNRIHSDYIQTQIISSKSLVDRYESQLSLANQVEGIIASNDEGIQEFMQRYFDSLQNLADNPTSNTNRQLVLDEANNLESLVANLTTVIKDTQGQVGSQLGGLTLEINNRLETIQAVNEQVKVAENNGSQTPNDLLDQRDQAILELSEYIDIETYRQPDGTIDIHAGKGKLPLLSDNTITPLQTNRSPYSGENQIEIYMSLGGVSSVVTNLISGGQVGGVIDFRENMLEKAQNDLGLTLNGLTAAANWQHYQGYDMNGNAGGDIFEPLSMNAINNTNNTGAETGANIAVSFNPNAGVSEPPYDGLTPLTSQPATYGAKETLLQNAFTQIGDFEPREYELRYDAGTDAFEFFDYKTGAAVVDNAGTPVTVNRGATGNVEGMSFDFTGMVVAPADNDSFLVKPHQQILIDFGRKINATDELATRGQTPIDADNDGSLLDEVPSAAAEGDNVNVANLANLQSLKLLLSDSTGQGSETLLGGYSLMATNVGMYVRSSEIQLTAQTNVFEQMIDQRESLSGVSLDEEATNLIRYQQAYEAAAQLITTSQSMFQTIIGAIRG